VEMGIVAPEAAPPTMQKTIGSREAERSA
jgi:hypothetical protein